MMSNASYYTNRVQNSPSRLGPIFDTDSYRNVLFILSMFVISIFTFVYVVTGVSLAVGLGVTIFGLPVAYFFMLSLPFLVQGLTIFTSNMTGYDVAPPVHPQFEGNMIEQTIALAKSRTIWQYIAFLVLIFPLSILAFTLIITLLSISIGFMAVISYPLVKSILGAQGIDIGPAFDYFIIPAWTEWIIVIAIPIIGVALFTYTLQVTNALAKYYAETLHKYNYLSAL